MNVQQVCARVRDPWGEREGNMNTAGNWDAIIIGGGIVGCAAAYYLTRSGMKPLIIEQDNIGAAQSSRNLGFVRQQARDFRELDLMIRALEIWKGLETELGRSIGWLQHGNLSLAFSEAELASREEWCAEAQRYGLDTRMLAAKDVMDLVPDLSSQTRLHGAMYTATDGQAEPTLVTRAYFEAAQARGAEVLLGSSVQQIETEAGRAIGVRVNRQVLRARSVICAAGSGSERLLRKLGIFLPQEKIRATVVRTAPIAPRLSPCISGPTTGIRQGASGAIQMSVAGGEYDVRVDSLRYARWYRSTRRKNPGAARINVLNPIGRFSVPSPYPTIADIPPSREKPCASLSRIAQAHDEFKFLFPDLAYVPLVASWAGYIDTLPDLIPVIGTTSSIGNLLIATGFSGHGFGPGPKVGMLLADVIAGRKIDTDISALSPDRFSVRVPPR